ncbi:MAG TPA: hypothetical protein VHP14_18330 [Anaerolineales bacterium]|nr:hypothetical protein [Anaerolineales bacterium]
MEIFGVGPAELFFVFLLAIIILGPKDMQKAGRTIGRFLNQLVRSDSWKVFQKTSAEIRNLPRNLMREANLEEVDNTIQDTGAKLQDASKEIRQTMDAHLQPPPATPAASVANEDKQEPSPSNQTDPSAVEPTADNMDKNG